MRIRVVAHDSVENVAQGESSASFTILGIGPPALRLVGPNGGETLMGGSTATIRWDAPSGGVSRIASYDLLLSIDGGRAFSVVIASNLPGSSRSFDWTLPRHVATTEARLRVIARDASGRILVLDESDADFAIVRP